MRRFHRPMTFALSALLMLSMLLQPALAVDSQENFPAAGTPLEPSEVELISDSIYETLQLYAATSKLSLSKNGVAFIVQYEGFDEHPYWDYGQWTVGYGTNYTVLQKLYPDLFPEDLPTSFDDEAFQAATALAGTITVTRDQAEAAFAEEIQRHETTVNNYLNSYGIQVNQNQFDALVSFTYNLGSQWLPPNKNSDGTKYKIRILLEDTDPALWTYDRVEEALIGWVNAGGTQIAGLVQRRKAEAALFVTPSSGAVSGRTQIAAFTDVYTSDWYAEAVQEVYDRGIMVGVGDGIFDPTGQLTRAQMVRTVASMMSADLSRYRWSAFDDVPLSAWYAPAVAWADQQGIVSGVGGGLFEPNAVIQRQHVCNILARYLRGLGVPAGNTQITFRDAGDIQPSARENVSYCVSLGLISGMGDGNFSPTAPMTRAQAASILVRTAALLEARGLL